MSSRAIQALRKKQGDTSILPVFEDESSEDDEDDDDNIGTRGGNSAFAGMMDDESSSEEEEEEDEDEDKADEGGDDKKDGDILSRCDDNVAGNKIESVAQAQAKKGGATKKVETAEELEVLSEAESDLDEILAEFQEKDGELAELETPGELSEGPSVFGIILADMEPRDLDYDFSMRTSVLGGASTPAPSSSNRQRKNRQTVLFGPPRDGWSRPPHFVGGGIGMTTYDRDPRPIPWPYNSVSNDQDQDQVQPDNQEGGIDASEVDEKHWFTFMYSETYQQDCEDYRQIQQSGDLNALVMFVAHHPFVTDALLQLTTVLYQTNHSQEGLSLLRRCLWIYECSSLLNFTRELDCRAFMDHDQKENSTYFRALFQLVQVSNIAGLPQTSLAVSRYILALDPLRDPMGVLLALDHYALACNSSQLDQWLVNLVESDTIHIRYRDMRTSKTSRCGLLDLPNWAFSYALALFRLQSESPSDDSKLKADQAIQAALSMFPNVVGLLLQGNEVDTTGRSFARDWISVLDFASDRSKQLRNSWWSAGTVDTIILTATLQACDLVTKIAVQQNAKLWGDDEVLQWLFDNLKELQSTKLELPTFPSPAMLRYASCDPSDYENKIQMLPPDMNVIDPAALAHAMEVNTNRPRLIRRMHRGGGAGPALEEHEHDANGLPANHRPQPQRLLGPPTQVIDPDWPIAELFWRSFLPWNRVEGLPPTR